MSLLLFLQKNFQSKLVAKDWQKNLVCLLLFDFIFYINSQAFNVGFKILNNKNSEKLIQARNLKTWLRDQYLLSQCVLTQCNTFQVSILLFI